MTNINKQFASLLLNWFYQNKRALPWRETKNPYQIWVSEIILQQTRVDQGLPYFRKFIGRFPTVKKLAKARRQEVLRLWQGLGYYSRARNMHRCAQEIVRNYQGIIPLSYEELKKLPGIGDYTAAAISSICRNEPVAVVDGNVYRVLSRIFGIDAIINSTQGKKNFATLAHSLLPTQQSGNYNQAIMEFGALHCTPKGPSCDNCIFSRYCVAKAQSKQLYYPVKKPLAKKKRRIFNYLIICQNKKIWMKKRDGKDIWKDLYDFFLVERKKTGSNKKVIAEFKIAPGVEEKITFLETIRHEMTHQQIIANFYYLDYQQPISSGLCTGKFYTARQIQHLPKPVFIDRIIKRVLL